MSKYHDKSVDEIHQYWRNPSQSNEPQYYVNKLLRSEFLYQFIERYANANDAILEPGCNVGRNLNYLRQKGYNNLYGIEINKNALEMMDDVYNLRKYAVIYNDSVENIIKNFEDHQFDVTFTMAVLEHIHSDSDWVFSEIARITKSYLIIIEDETWISERHFPRNYQKIFESLGFTQIEFEEQCQGFGSGYVCRVLKKSE